MFDNLILSLNTVTPVLILTVLGMILKKIKLLPDGFYSAADKYVFDIALPASAPDTRVCAFFGRYGSRL